MTSLYDDVGGFDVLLALCCRWHDLCLADPVAAHPFEHPGHPQHNERLAAYLAEALGGPALFTGGYGDETYVQRLHAGNGEHVELDEACLTLFDRAVEESGIDPEAGRRLSSYFRRATEAQRAYADGPHLVPDDLPFNRA
ncbi:oxidoreductase [Nocardioides panacisoli]|uniref:Group II truncated hemoglobin n=1 Tax=Nocardioides panacisoli TaxID=627624 RepID=A0ABP7IC97_9ACTN